MFGAGTAAVISPVNGIVYKGEEDIAVPTKDDIGPFAKQLWQTLNDIQYGKVHHHWSVVI